MRIEFHGAAGEVTVSCYLITVGGPSAPTDQWGLLDW